MTPQDRPDDAGEGAAAPRRAAAWPVEPPGSPWAFASAVEALVEADRLRGDEAWDPLERADGPEGHDPADDADADDATDDDEGPDDLVATGADLEPGTLLDAYRHGLFPMPLGGFRSPMGWFCPVRRGVLELDGLKVSRSLRRSCRDVEVRVDSAFDDVLAACADPRRDHGWIDRRISGAYRRLHRLGWAHSVETWRDGELVGGLYGIAIGGLFAGESMFHRQRDASKVALVGLVELLREAQDDDPGDRLVDVQWRTDHLASLGVVEVPRAAYVQRLPGLLATPTPRELLRPRPGL